MPPLLVPALCSADPLFRCSTRPGRSPSFSSHGPGGVKPDLTRESWRGSMAISSIHWASQTLTAPSHRASLLSRKSFWGACADPRSVSASPWKLAPGPRALRLGCRGGRWGVLAGTLGQQLCVPHPGEQARFPSLQMAGLLKTESHSTVCADRAGVHSPADGHWGCGHVPTVDVAAAPTRLCGEPGVSVRSGFQLLRVPTQKSDCRVTWQLYF